MKIIKIMTGIIVVLSVSIAAYAQSTAVTSFQSSKEWNKVGGSLQSAWLDAMKSNDTKRRLDCFVRVRAPGGDKGDESFLDSKGFYVQMWSGTIARGHMDAEDLPDVAALPFVDSIELSKPPKTGN